MVIQTKLVQKCKRSDRLCDTQTDRHSALANSPRLVIISVWTLFKQTDRRTDSDNRVLEERNDDEDEVLRVLQQNNIFLENEQWHWQIGIACFPGIAKALSPKNFHSLPLCLFILVRFCLSLAELNCVLLPITTLQNTLFPSAQFKKCCFIYCPVCAWRLLIC